MQKIEQQLNKVKNKIKQKRDGDKKYQLPETKTVREARHCIAALAEQKIANEVIEKQSGQLIVDGTGRA